MNLCLLASLILLRLLIQEVLIVLELNSKTILYEECRFILDSCQHYILLSKIAGSIIITYTIFFFTLLPHHL